MEKLNFVYHQRLSKLLTSLGLTLALGFNMFQINIQAATGEEKLVQKTVKKYKYAEQKAYQLLQNGDLAYSKQNYKQAVKNYSQAFHLLPKKSPNSKLLPAAAKRYATAATERSRELAKSGKYIEAKKLLSDILSPNVASGNLAALKLQSQLDDPTRYNPALSQKAIQEVQEVSATLREAEGYLNLGKYDRAVMSYQDVLHIDPYNKAARRGLEKINNIKSNYYRTARNQTRSKLLSEVDSQWELPIPKVKNSPLLTPLLKGNEKFTQSLKEKLSSITIDTINLDNVSLDEALDFARIKSRDSSKEAINIVTNFIGASGKKAKAIRNARIKLTARNLPLSKVLDYITDQTSTQWRTDGSVVLVTPRGSSSSAIISRTFIVPPNFISSVNTQKAEPAEDIFSSEQNNSGGLLTKKISITDFLKSNGITFPEGASASYTASSNRLIARNTVTNLDLIDRLVSIISDEEPIQVAIRTTIMRVSEEKLKALNFDWLITPYNLGGKLFLGAGTVGNGNSLSDMPISPFSASASPVTSGVRSGNTGLKKNSINAFINAGSTDFGESSNIRAPGILTITGVYSGIQVQMIMRGMNQKTGADTISKPEIIARSGERAKVEIIREFIYPTEYEPPELPNAVGTSSSSFPVTPSMPTAFETRNVGVTMEVEPTVGPHKKFITLSINPELVEFLGFVNYGTPIYSFSSNSNSELVASPLTQNPILLPIFQTTRLAAQTVTVQDGSTIVLGGVMKSKKIKTEDKVPFLGDIPFAGRLFTSESEQTVNEAVIISIQAELLAPTGQPWNKR